MATIKLAPLCAALAITAAGVTLLASPSSAKERPVVVEGVPSEGVVVQRVSYADLDLASRSGNRLLYKRVGKAVVEVCNAANPGAQYADIFMCRDMSWDAARPQIRGALDRAQTLAARGQSSTIAGAVLIAVR